MSAPQYCNRANIPHSNQKFVLGIASGPCFFFQVHEGGHKRKNILMDFHPYGYETSIFTLGAPHEEA